MDRFKLVGVFLCAIVQQRIAVFNQLSYEGVEIFRVLLSMVSFLARLTGVALIYDYAVDIRIVFKNEQLTCTDLHREAIGSEESNCISKDAYSHL